MATTSPPVTTASLRLKCDSCGAWNRIAANRALNGPKCGKCAQPFSLDHPVALTAESFDRTVREATVPVLVDFYADWCGPCRMMAPFVDQLAAKNVGRALVAKLDTDKAPALSQRYQIRGIPTVIVFAQGRVVTQQSGAMPLAGLEQLLATAGS